MAMIAETGERMTDHVYVYSDAYEGCFYPNGQNLLADLRDICLDDWLAHYNIPVWVSVDEYEGKERLEVGIMMPRHGNTCAWITDTWTQDDLMEIRKLMLSVWALRADTGFTRMTVNQFSRGA